MNVGALGSVIGHEIPHGFEAQATKLVTWGQLRADEPNEAWLRPITATDPHPPGRTRARADA